MYLVLILASVISMVTAIAISEHRSSDMELNVTHQLMKNHCRQARQRELERRRLYWLLSHCRKR